jgi:AraC-like DNA-binding protein/mannose-6-phosphate isomerase-like protein (cupin superfamily)
MEQHKYSQDDDRLHVELARQIHLEMAGLVHCPKGWTGKLHSHPFWEFIFINSGEGEMKFGNRVVPMKKNELYLIPPLEAHQFVNTGREKVENLYVGFAFEVEAPPAAQGALRLEPLGDSLITGLRELTGSFKGIKAGSSFRNQALIFEIIYRVLDLVRGHPELASRFSIDKNGIIADKARKFLESNVHKNVSVEEVAAKFFLSPHYFSRKFKAETGLGIKEFHNRARMEKSLELLRDPLLSVSDVARKLGFNNVNYFTNKFREHFRVPPTEKRKKLGVPL